MYPCREKPKWCCGKQRAKRLPLPLCLYPDSQNVAHEGLVSGSLGAGFGNVCFGGAECQAAYNEAASCRGCFVHIRRTTGLCSTLSETG